MPQLAYYPAAGLFFASRGDSSDPSMYASRVFAKETEYTSGHTMIGGRRLSNAHINRPDSIVRDNIIR